MIFCIDENQSESSDWTESVQFIVLTVGVIDQFNNVDIYIYTYFNF